MFDIVVPLAFFVLLLVFALVILMLKAGDMRSERPELDEDLMQQRASVELISVLRMVVPADIASADGASNRGNAPLGDIVILNNDGRYNDTILRALDTAFTGGSFFDITIDYPGRPLRIRNKCIEGRSGEMYGEAQAYLPSSTGALRVTMLYTTEEALGRIGARTDSDGIRYATNDDCRGKI